MKEWFTTQELAGLPEVPGTPQNIIVRASRESWQSRKRIVGKGFEYHISSLPKAAQSALIKKQQKKSVAKPVAKTQSTESLWLRYEQAPQSLKDEAQRRVQALELAQRLIDHGIGKSAAAIQAADEYGTNRATIYRWQKAVKGFHRSDWLSVLVPKYTGRTKTAECTPAAWECFKADYLRLEKPALTACYERLKRASMEQGWEIPAERTLARWVKDRIPSTTNVLLREGEHALMRRFPALERSVQDVYALQWINGDGYQHNVFVKWPDGTIARPKTWFWQDIHSRKVLSYRVDITEHTDQIRLSFGDLIEQYGIPEHATIDNTRAAANKWMTGGIPNRYRFKVKEDDPLGLFPTLGIDVHWTSVINGKGHGQAKPIERAFGVGGLGEYIDKHPAFTGAYTGPNPMAKPDNYGSKAIPLDKFLQVLNQEIIAWNAKGGRRTEICAGKLSFDDAFNKSYASAPIRKATSEQRRLWMLTAEAVTVKPDGTFTLEAGAQIGGGRNRYFAHDLQTVGEERKKVVIRFDPTNLHESVHCYTLDNRYICQADILNSAGFGDTQVARIHSRTRRNWIKANKEAAKAEVIMDALEAAEKIGGPSLPDPEANKVVMPMRNSIEMPKPKEEPEPEEPQQTPDQQLAEILSIHQSPKLEEETEQQVYERWLALEQCIDKGEALEGKDALFFKTYQDTAEYRTYSQLNDMGMLQLQG